MIASPTKPALRVGDLHAYYGESHILRDVSLEIAPGETVALLGRNGAGKTTLLKSIVGWVRPRSGSVEVNGVDVAGREMMQIARLGVLLVPGMVARPNLRKIPALARALEK